MTAPMIAVENLTRRYPGVLAMDRVSMQIYPGEVIGLVGKNGAGKSTLIRMLSGLERRNGGEILIDGAAVGEGYGPRDAQRAGIAVMHQELANIDDMSVAENIALGQRLPRRFGVLVDWPALVRAVKPVLQELELAVDPMALVGSLTMVQKRLVMIARALYLKARLLILDEPSTSLTNAEISHLHRIVAKMRAAGRAVIYISHRLHEIKAITDRVIVMQDGRVTGAFFTKDLVKEDLVAFIAGPTNAAPKAQSARPATAPAAEGRLVVLELRDLVRLPAVKRCSLKLHQGEILGIAGLVGSGRSEFLRLISGADAASSGEVIVKGGQHRIRSPRDAMKHGIVLLPEDRRHQGLITSMSVRENITLAALQKHRTLYMLRQGRETATSQDLIQRLSIKTPSPEQLVKNLSGGNQQKVVLAKWLARQAEIFIFDEPTQGVDVQARGEMFAQIRALAQAGKSSIVVSSDFSELELLCDRVVIMREGQISGELRGDEITEPAMTAMTYIAG